MKQILEGAKLIEPQVIEEDNFAVPKNTWVFDAETKKLRVGVTTLQKGEKVVLVPQLAGG